MAAEGTRNSGRAGLHVLITRPLQQARRTAKALEEDGHTCRIEPLLSVHPLAGKPPDGPVSAVAVTSVNAIAALQEHPALKDRPAYCTGERTARALRQAGFDDIRIARGGAAALASLVAAVPPTREGAVIYPCAQVTAQDMVALLARHAIPCVPWPVYEAREATAFSPAIRRDLADHRFDAVLLYSARTASAFTRLFTALPPQTRWPVSITLSAEICARLPQEAHALCHAAAEPDEDAVRSILAQMMQ